MLQTVRVQKYMKKCGYLSSFHVSFLLPAFCADLCKKPKSVKVIYIYTFGSSHYTLSKNDMIL